MHPRVVSRPASFKIRLTRPRAWSSLGLTPMARRGRKSRDVIPPLPVGRPVAEGIPRHWPSATAVAAEVIRTGVLPSGAGRRRAALPHEDETILVGDPDDDSIANEYVGEETPGGSNPTPDQSGVDDIGRAYGLQDEDSGSLHSGAEVLGRRDRHRQELQPPRRRP